METETERKPVFHCKPAERGSRSDPPDTRQAALVWSSAEHRAQNTTLEVKGLGLIPEKHPHNRAEGLASSPDTTPRSDAR